MKTKLLLSLFTAAMLLPLVSNLFDLDARRRGTGPAVVVDDPSTVIVSPN